MKKTMVCKKSPLHAKGLTLVELLITVTVFIVMITIAVPSMSSFMRDARTASQLRTLVDAIAYARSESVTRNMPVSLCSTDNGSTCKVQNNLLWESGWIAFTDENQSGTLNTGETLLRVYQSQDTAYNLVAAVGSITFRSSGFLQGGPVVLNHKPSRCNAENKEAIVTIEPSGSVHVYTGHCG